MSRKLLRTGLAAALAALLAGPVQAADFGSRSAADGLWQWLTGMWQNAIGMEIDPDGSNAPTGGGEREIHGTIDPDGDSLTVPGGEGKGEISLTIVPNG
jgi:hypothetical protein